LRQGDRSATSSAWRFGVCRISGKRIAAGRGGKASNLKSKNFRC